MEVLKSTLRKQCCVHNTVVQIAVYSNSEMAIFIDELSRNSLSYNIARTSFIDKKNSDISFRHHCLIIDLLLCVTVIVPMY
ncbi:hypothetical protein T4B_14828 [Trichinella pseudospiralis]|uniref:Uncharacterized protein n=1 Tax=Trichinella pseudospiralis TaxID=6337 RepID=A0A0V1IXS1_TRIPS|nr:hypothetical protein T4B_14828 [Trichinella pseudospiralis]